MAKGEVERRKEGHEGNDEYIVYNRTPHLTSDLSIFYKPHSVTVLLVGCCLLFWVGLQREGQYSTEENVRTAVYGVMVLFLLFALVQFPDDGPFARPHPAVWRVVLGISILYLLFLVFLFFQSIDDARWFFHFLDPSLGNKVVLPLYAEDCSLKWEIIWDKLDLFILCHFFGWFVKALLLRDLAVCMCLSVLWEVMELTFISWLPNFAECWWDQIILDIVLCNGLGMVLGLQAAGWLEMKEYNWVGFKDVRGVGNKMQRIAMQFTPRSWTVVEWGFLSSFRRTGAVLMLVVAMVVVELNAFFLKALLWIPSNNNLNLYRLGLWVAFGAPALREYYVFVSDPTVKKVGVQCWVAIGCVLAETAITLKFGRHEFQDPLPSAVTTPWILVIALFSLTYGTWYAWSGRGIFKNS